MDHLTLRSIVFLAETLQLLAESSGMQELCQEGRLLSPSDPELQRLSESAERASIMKKKQSRQTTAEFGRIHEVDFNR